MQLPEFRLLPQFGVVVRPHMFKLHAGFHVSHAELDFKRERPISKLILFIADTTVLNMRNVSRKGAGPHSLNPKFSIFQAEEHESTPIAKQANLRNTISDSEMAVLLARLHPFMLHEDLVE